MDLTAIRMGLADRARFIVPNVSHYAPSAIHSYPHVFVEMPDGEMIAMRQTSWAVMLDVVAAMSDVWDRAAQEKVDALVTSLWPILEGDQTLDGTINGSVTVQSFEAIRPQDNAPYVGARFRVKVVHTDA